MMFIPASIVPEVKADEFLAIAGKDQNFYHGYVRIFACRGEEYEVDTRYDDDLRRIGLLSAQQPKEKA